MTKEFDAYDAREALPPMNVTVCIGKKKAREAVSECGVEVNWDSAGFSARAETGEGGFLAVVYISKATARGDVCELADTVAHEATHCASFFMDYIGESEPAEEQFAYAVGAFTQCIMQEVSEWRTSLKTRERKTRSKTS